MKSMFDRPEVVKWLTVLFLTVVPIVAYLLLSRLIPR